VNVHDVLLWGFIATVVLTTLLAAAQGLGRTRISIPYLLGTMFTPSRDRALFVGSLIHLANGWLFAAIYAAAFQSMGHANALLGAAAGLLHGLFILMVGMPIMPALHPRMAGELQGPTPTRQLQPPGFLALHYGRQTPIVSLFAHAVYGAILGGFYHVVK
jgi:hypothetical protein